MDDLGAGALLGEDLEEEGVGGAAVDEVDLVDTDVEPFDPKTAEVPPVDAGIGERRPGGLGIYLVRSMVDDLNYDYETEGRRMRITVTKTLEN